jgi:hypothetical protein
VREQVVGQEPRRGHRRPSRGHLGGDEGGEEREVPGELLRESQEYACVDVVCGEHAVVVEVEQLVQ